LDPTVVAVTGSNGKTTTRELIVTALGSGVYGSPGNFNNLVGVPLTLLGAPEDRGVWVLELASNSPGEIDRLGRMAEPDLAVITTVAEAHLEGLGDLAGVLEEKLALLDTLRPDGWAAVGEAPPELPREARRRFEPITVTGLGPEADEPPERWSLGPDGIEFVWRGVEFGLPPSGRHLLANALSALAVADRLGEGPVDVAARWSGVQLPPMRGEIRRVGDIVLLVDCYNANPASFRAAIETLAALSDGRRRVAVVGSMLELGERSACLHEKVAAWLEESGIEIVAATGAFVDACQAMAAESCELIVGDDPEEAYERLQPRLQGDEVVLLKASRGVRMERLVPLFERDFG
jgi:UDP-N-acetylmuramoyl-tripeptide--D-alanyl-D-alanine ligase